MKKLNYMYLQDVVDFEQQYEMVLIWKIEDKVNPVEYYNGKRFDNNVWLPIAYLRVVGV